MTARVLVLGGSGFIGSAVVQALLRRGAETRTSPAPRLNAVTALDAAECARHARARPELHVMLDWANVVVNTAGLSDAGSCEESELNAANAAMPAMIARLARDAGVQRFLHVSSAAVQGDRLVLDSSEDMQPFSPYSRSKALGERLLLDLGWPGLVLYRPQGVHGPGRQVTRSLTRLARSPLASVAAPGDQPTPQAPVANVADATAFLALTQRTPPRIVLHPWEGLTTASLLQHLGGRRPVRIPAVCARYIVAALRTVGRRHPRTAANARRVQMMWFGQAVEPSWMTDAGWRPVTDLLMGVATC
ncbi:NAD-dependent epimerase/dehydratase family protein [Jatrophihabitans lederbergiae]|uniref:NAD(P)-dependent oxidoreductase n=1 Tax=Jatrophihabitans lederbergiae TaxID=3075547 RepID=A0ABU2JBN6_9ACTN|nr:NAD(P)-dependent oxidoreductase [Jatrophihabitans sp. DSM 44399]MDT0262074.1 NAD(P)-dependent oxidoreductase [Jatrophihabitans sp. DSM 44399]